MSACKRLYGQHKMRGAGEMGGVSTGGIVGTIATRALLNLALLIQANNLKQLVTIVETIQFQYFRYMNICSVLH